MMQFSQTDFVDQNHTMVENLRNLISFFLHLRKEIQNPYNIFGAYPTSYTNGRYRSTHRTPFLEWPFRAAGKAHGVYP